jgi:hypothetical protein
MNPSNDNEELDFAHISADCGMVADGWEVERVIAEEVVFEALINGMGKMPEEIRERQAKDAKLLLVLSVVLALFCSDALAIGKAGKLSQPHIADCGIGKCTVRIADDELAMFKAGWAWQREKDKANLRKIVRGKGGKK